MAYLPSDAKRALDVGCGDGIMTRELASRGIGVLGIDVSPRMIQLARERTELSLPVEYRQLDVMSNELSNETFDVVISVSVVHHAPLDEIVPRLTALVAPGGTLLIQDVMNRRGLWQLPANTAAFALQRLRELGTSTRTPRRVTTLYERHGEAEQYLDVSAVSAVYGALLPSAQVTTHLEWRYSVVWHRPR